MTIEDFSNSFDRCVEKVKNLCLKAERNGLITSSQSDYLNQAMLELTIWIDMTLF